MGSEFLQVLPLYFKGCCHYENMKNYIFLTRKQYYHNHSAACACFVTISNSLEELSVTMIR